MAANQNTEPKRHGPIFRETVQGIKGSVEYGGELVRQPPNFVSGMENAVFKKERNLIFSGAVRRIKPSIPPESYLQEMSAPQRIKYH